MHKPHKFPINNNNSPGKDQNGNYKSDRSDIIKCKHYSCQSTHLRTFNYLSVQKSLQTKVNLQRP